MMTNDITPSNNSVFLPSTVDEQTDFDINYARQNITQLIETGIEGARQLADIADQSQNSLAYERLSTFLKTVSELNKDLVDLAKSRKELNKEEPPPNNPVNNNLFVGSTAEFQAMLKQINKDSDKNEI